MPGPDPNGENAAEYDIILWDFLLTVNDDFLLDFDDFENSFSAYFD